jgi:co-chaperonin GroES (HSP10)
VTEGGIVIPDDTAEREDMAQIDALVCEVGAGCWADQKEVHIDSLGSKSLKLSREWASPGDHILIAKFAGFYRRGRDGRHYRVISDLDVIAVLDREKEDGRD